MPHDDTSLSTANPDLTVVERRVLDRIFQHPMSHNLSWREVFELFRATGEVEQTHNGNVVLKQGGKHLTFAPKHDKDVGPDDVMLLRHLLKDAGWTPESMPKPDSRDPAPAIAIVIDHAGARIYDLPVTFGHETPHETHHEQHFIDRTQHDADREETYPADHRFFDAIARDVPGKAQIVVLSHGTGQSNEGDHLLEYMGLHQRLVHDRIVGVIVADLPHTTVPELLQMARQALRPRPNSADGSAD